MKLYNTLTRTVDSLVPLAAPVVTIYTCGPTVYDYLHIGNWFTYVREDTLIRTLKLSGYTPEWVMNITDVGHLVSDADDGEDKLEKGARREGKTAWDVAEFYTQDFLECMQLLHISAPNHVTKATDHIPEQIALIKTLEEKGYTYIIQDGVYYDTSKFEGYAAFARLDLEGLQAGARVEYSSEKRNPSDFALWKFSPQEQSRDMEWDSPWSPPGADPHSTQKGFPGWHIECSAMSMKYLGDTLDIHAGGIDHIPVHHTNEIAQSEAATGKRFANYWLHANHVMIDGDKISKSLGNGIRLQDLAAQGFTAEVVRLHILESHYRSQSQFSINNLEAARNRLRGLYALAVLRFQTTDISVENSEKEGSYDYAGAAATLIALLSEDLNTPEALSHLSAIETELTQRLIPSDDRGAFQALLQTIDDAFGLSLLDQPDIADGDKQLLADRATCRDAKDWQRSDQIRQQLMESGIEVRDTPSGQIWYRSL